MPALKNPRHEAFICKEERWDRERGKSGSTDTMSQPENEAQKRKGVPENPVVRIGIDAPLKLPEIRRDDIGRFERKGTLAKAAKFKQEQPAIRRPGGTPFQPGVSGNPAGKPKGTLNKVTKDLKQAILGALEAAGGKEGGVGYLRRLAIENSSAFASLLGKVLPTTLAADESSGGLGVKMVFERHIVWPDGRREIQGVTPKALPAPDASNARPRPTDLTDDTNEGAV